VGGVEVRTSPVATARPVATPTNAFLRDLPFSAELARPQMTFEEASRVCVEASERLGFPFKLDWASSSERLEIDVHDATELVIPGGVARSQGMTPDSFALVLAHERGHRVLETMDEARADYWAARYGARMLWPDLSHDELLRKGFLAAYSILSYLKKNEPLSLL